MEEADKEPSVGEMIERAMCDLHDAVITLSDEDVGPEEARQNMREAITTAHSVQSNADPGFWLAAGGNTTGTEQVHELGILINELESLYPWLHTQDADE